MIIEKSHHAFLDITRQTNFAHTSALHNAKPLNQPRVVVNSVQAYLPKQGKHLCPDVYIFRDHALTLRLQFSKNSRLETIQVDDAFLFKKYAGCHIYKMPIKALESEIFLYECTDETNFIDDLIDFFSWFSEGLVLPALGVCKLPDSGGLCYTDGPIAVFLPNRAPRLIWGFQDICLSLPEEEKLDPSFLGNAIPCGDLIETLFKNNAQPAKEKLIAGYYIARTGYLCQFLQKLQLRRVNRSTLLALVMARQNFPSSFSKTLFVSKETHAVLQRPSFRRFWQNLGYELEQELESPTQNENLTEKLFFSAIPREHEKLLLERYEAVFPRRIFEDITDDQ